MTLIFDDVKFLMSFRDLPRNWRGRLQDFINKWIFQLFCLPVRVYTVGQKGQNGTRDNIPTIVYIGSVPFVQLMFSTGLSVVWAIGYLHFSMPTTVEIWTLESACPSHVSKHQWESHSLYYSCMSLSSVPNLQFRAIDATYTRHSSISHRFAICCWNVRTVAL